MEPWEVGDCCIVCGYPYTQIHHVFHGYGRRKKSDKYGYVVRLCQRHHTGADGIHQSRNREYDLALMRRAQEHFEENFGTREDFIKEFGKSFL